MAIKKSKIISKNKNSDKSNVTSSNDFNTSYKNSSLIDIAEDKMFILAKAEQDHRHRWENHYLKAMAANHRIGQLLMFVFAIILIYSSIAFVMVHNAAVAVIVVIAGFSFLCVQCIQNSKSKRYVDKLNKIQN